MTKRIAFLLLVCLALSLCAAGQARAENLQVPFGENKSLWDLVTDPWTQYLGDLFYAVLVALVAGVVWIKAGVGPALAFFTLANAVLALLLPGQSAPLFAIMAAIAFAGLVLRAVTGP